MLDSNFYDEAPQPVSRIINSAENRLIQEIARKIKSMHEISGSVDYEIQRLSTIRTIDREFRTILSDMTKLSLIEIDEIFKQAAESAYVYDKALYEAKGVEFVEYKDNDFLQQLTKSISDQTQSEFTNLTQTIGFRDSDGRFRNARDTFVNKLDEVTFQVTSGTSNYDDAIKRAVKSLVESGIRVVDYESGHTDRVEVATRRAVLTGVGQLANQVAIRTINEINAEHIQVSMHDGARTGNGWGDIKDHSAWQGKIFAKNGVNLTTLERETTEKDKDYPDFIKYTGYGTGDGIGGWNCRHNFSGFLPRLMDPNYSDEEIAEQQEKDKEITEWETTDRKGNKVVNEYTRYKATQEQRRMERIMRKTRALAVGYKSGGNMDAYTETKSKYKAQRAEYKKFSEAMSLQPQWERVYVDGLSRI